MIVSYVNLRAWKLLAANCCTRQGNVGDQQIFVAEEERSKGIPSAVLHMELPTTGKKKGDRFLLITTIAVPGGDFCCAPNPMSSPSSNPYHGGYHGPYYASPNARSSRETDMAVPDEGCDARHCVRVVEDYHLLDFSERLNTSSYVNVVFEPEEEKVALMGLKVNLADQTVYPESFRMHNDTLNMIAKAWHCPKPDDFDDYGCYAGAGTVGSTEACLLAGLALKFRWRKWYDKKQ
eukprot:s2739_g13.t3